MNKRRQNFYNLCGLFALPVVINCGGGITLAPKAQVPTGEWVAVSSLPPAALPEEIPALTESQSDLVWADGCWEWSIGRWIWVRGGWVDVPQGGAYFPDETGVDPDGGLVWSPCSWFVNNERIGLITPVVPARYPPSARSIER